MAQRVLIHTLIYGPDGVSTAYLYRDIALALKEAGMDVRVLTTTPHFNIVEEELRKQPLRWKVWPLLKKSEHDGIKVTHVPIKKFKSTPVRLLSFVYWHVVSLLTALFMKKADVILSPSPPLTIGLLNLWIGKLKGSKVVYNVQEVYPDILGIKEGTVYNVLSKMERHIYDKSDAVTTIDDIFHGNIVGRFKDPSKLKIIPNFVDTDVYRPMKTERKEDGKLRLLYAGNVGMAQDWDTLVELARALKADGDARVEFTVIGEGVKLPYLKEKVKEYGLDNIRILPYQPRERMPEIIAGSDMQFIFMEPEIAAQGFPSKVYTIMACGKPLLICSPQATPIVNFLRPVGCAKLVTETEMGRKVAEIKEWLTSVDASTLEVMGSRGHREIEGRYSKDVVTRSYVELIEKL